MGEIWIEWRSVAGLGDHLYLVYRENETAPYDTWEVIRGGPPLGVTALPYADQLVGQAGMLLMNSEDAFDLSPPQADPASALYDPLFPADGTDDEKARYISENYNGSRVIYAGGDAGAKWAEMIAVANDLHAQYTYKAASLTAVSLDPTINSNSFVASVLHHVGIEIETNEPFGVGDGAGWVGSRNILGRSTDDLLVTEGETVVLFAGAGADTLIGDDRDNALQGGLGDDLFLPGGGDDWIHGGQRRAFTASAALLLVAATTAQAQPDQERAPGGSEGPIIICPAGECPDRPEVHCTTKGCDIARSLIAESKEHERGWVGLHEIDDQVCLVPESRFAPYYVARFFPGYDLTYEENIDSEGFWFIVAGSSETRRVYLYKVDIRVLELEPQFTVCTTNVGIDLGSHPPKLYIPRG